LRIRLARFITDGESVVLTGQGYGVAVELGSGAQAFRAQLVVPEQRQLYDYWQDVAGENAIPARADINPVRLPRLLPGISLIEVHSDISRCRIRLAGTRLRDIYDREVTGMLVADLPHGNRAEYWLAAYKRTIELALPTQGVVRGPIVNKEHVVQYWLKLPLRYESQGVGMVLCYDHFVPASEILQEQDQKISVAS
jgi:PAS domain